MSIRLRIIMEMQRIADEQQVTLPPLDDDLHFTKQVSIRSASRSWWRGLKTISASIRLPYRRMRRFLSPWATLSRPMKMSFA